MALLLLIKNERIFLKDFFAPLLAQWIYYLKERGCFGDKGMASNSQSCDKTAGGALTLVGTCPGHSPQGEGSAGI